MTSISVPASRFLPRLPFMKERTVSCKMIQTLSSQDAFGDGTYHSNVKQTRIPDKSTFSALKGLAHTAWAVFPPHPGNFHVHTLNLSFKTVPSLGPWYCLLAFQASCFHCCGAVCGLRWTFLALLIVPSTTGRSHTIGHTHFVFFCFLTFTHPLWLEYSSCQPAPLLEPIQNFARYSTSPQWWRSNPEPQVC